MNPDLIHNIAAAGNRRDQPSVDFPDTGVDGKPHPAVVLDLDYTTG
jgi:hypothetical protein